MLVTYLMSKSVRMSDIGVIAVCELMMHFIEDRSISCSFFRDWTGETTTHPREVIEHALAHQLKDKADVAYARGTLFDKRRRLMTDWAAHCAIAAVEGDNAVQSRGVA